MNKREIASELMDWFQHRTGSFDDPDIFDAMELYGDAGYVVFFSLLELYGREFNKTDDEGKLTLTQGFLANKLRRPIGEIVGILGFFKERGRVLVTVDDTAKPPTITFCVPAFLEIASNWTKRKTPTRAGASPPTEGPLERPLAKEEKKKRTEKEKKKNKDIPYEDIIDYLNKVCERKFPHNTADTIGHINARVAEGATLEDFKKCIDNKSKEWKGDRTMDKYLRPSTLFNSEKFWGYVNEGNTSGSKAGGYRGSGVAI